VGVINKFPSPTLHPRRVEPTVSRLPLARSQSIALRATAD